MRTHNTFIHGMLHMVQFVHLQAVLTMLCKTFVRVQTVGTLIRGTVMRKK